MAYSEIFRINKYRLIAWCNLQATENVILYRGRATCDDNNIVSRLLLVSSKIINIGPRT
jgi:hypothetical protein